VPPGHVLAVVGGVGICLLTQLKDWPRAWGSVNWAWSAMINHHLCTGCCSNCTKCTVPAATVLGHS
jgi:hypothetical protein